MDIEFLNDQRTQLLKFAHMLADTARPIARRYFRAGQLYEMKIDETPVSKADIEIELMCRNQIKQSYPSHGIIGEEFSQTMGDSDFCWVIDPIDGTKAFVSGKPLFGVLISLAYRGRPILGIMDQPFTNERWVGYSKCPTYYNGAVATVQKISDIKNAIAYTANPEMFSEIHSTEFKRLASTVKWCLYNADCYAYGLLSLGEVHIVFEQHLKPHDYFALVPIIEGAGGVISDWAGKPLTLHSDGTVLATSSKNLWDTVINILG